MSKSWEECFVVAGTHTEFAYYAKEKHDGIHYIYVRDETVLMGQKDIKGTFIGTWYQRPDIEVIIDRLSMVSSSIEGIIKARKILIDKCKQKEYTNRISYISTPSKGKSYYGYLAQEIDNDYISTKKEKTHTFYTMATGTIGNPSYSDTIRRWLDGTDMG